MNTKNIIGRHACLLFCRACVYAYTVRRSKSRVKRTREHQNTDGRERDSFSVIGDYVWMETVSFPVGNLSPFEKDIPQVVLV